MVFWLSYGWLMQARRYRVISLGIVLAVVGAVAPLAAMAYASWQIAIAKELSILREHAVSVTERAKFTFSDARQALVDTNAANVAPCSQEHIALMRKMTMNTVSVEEIGYFEGGKLKCTSWGITEADIRKEGGDYTTSNGVQVHLRILPLISRGKSMTELSLGSYNALVVPSRFVDVELRPGISLVLFSNTGLLIDGVNDPDVSFARHHLHNDDGGIDGERMFASVVGDGVVAVASEQSKMVYGQLRRELALFLPVGLFIAAFIVVMVVVFSRGRLSPRAELEFAIQKRQFIVHYQPIVELATGICVGAEALVRWRRRDGSLVRPDLFIPLAEETGLIVPITDQVLDEVVRELNTVLVGDRGLHIAINLSAADIKSGRFIDMIAEKLQHTGIRNEQIWLEATERGFIDVDAARANLDRARRAGHSIAIDDFGTGYSSLQYLQGLPVDALKIDKSFIDTIGRGAATSSVTLHIIEMAKELGLFSVAEGVETEAQAAYLREHGVSFGQGWLFSKPLAAKEFIEFRDASVAKFGKAPEIIRADN
ncbi:sensor c-di-GMP phosphodiesterase-like protein [Rhizobium leguminosarum]